VLVLPDAIGCNPPALLAQLHEALGFVPVLGAVAAGEPMFELYNTDAEQGALVGVALSGLTPIIGVAQGCMPIGEPYVITRAEANVIQRIGNRPALQMLEDAIRGLPGAEARIRRAGVFAGLAMDPAKSPLERGDFLVRNLVGADQSSGALAVAERVRVGQTVQFQIRDAEASRDDLGSMLDDVASRLGGRRPAFGCYFDCAGRGRGLFGVPDHDVTFIRERLGDFPLIGFFGNGEFAPIGRRNFFHNYTGALVVFPED
jgi:small ligand-binding sensory domain FIST